MSASRSRQVDEVGCRSLGAREDRTESVALERPLEIRLGHRPLAVTLRTPGTDPELALGFLLAEGVIEQRQDVVGWRCDHAEPRGDRIEVDLTEEALDRWARRKVQREFIATSACGACGKVDLDALFVEPIRAGRDTAPMPVADLTSSAVSNWIAAMRKRQPLFAATGAVHAAAAFSADGVCIGVFEDVGRHNALDKLIGAQLLRDEVEDRPLLQGGVVLSSGRAGFEIVQKTVRARASALVCLGAATSLAVELAGEAGLPLIAFAAGERPSRYG